MIRIGHGFDVHAFGPGVLLASPNIDWDISSSGKKHRLLTRPLTKLETHTKIQRLV